MTMLTTGSQGPTCTRYFDQYSEEWLETLLNQFFEEFDTGVEATTILSKINKTAIDQHS
jgi:hypothetical protein